MTDFQKDRGESHITSQIPGKRDIKTPLECFLRLSRGAFGSLVQGGLEPPDALDRQDLGVASVLPRTDGQGADLAGCGIAEMTAFFLLR